MGAARRFFAKTTVCSAAPARLSVVTQAQGTASHGFPVLHSHTNHQGSSRSSWELKSHFFFHEESLDPEQHYNRCLNHFFPAYSVIPLKTHAFHFLTNHRWEHLAFSSFIFSLSYQRFPGWFFFQCLCRSPRESRRLWQGDPSSSLTQGLSSRQRKLQPHLKVRTS